VTELFIEVQLKYLVMGKLKETTTPLTAHDVAAALAENERIWQNIGEDGGKKLFHPRISGILSKMAEDNFIACVAYDGQSKAYCPGPQADFEKELRTAGHTILDVLRVEVKNFDQNLEDDFVPQVECWLHPPKLLLTPAQIAKLARQFPEWFG